jgi:pyridoxal 5'-phosphate synthase pdxT subunit
MQVGVVAIQGDFEKHIHSIKNCKLTNITIKEIRTAEDLAGIDKLIIPGGESTTVGMLMQRFGLGPALKKAGKEGMPIWGTCMGMIMLAKEIEGRNQYSLELLDIKVRRNAFGAQVHSFETPVPIQGLEEPVMGVFIRAPIVVEQSDDVETLSKLDGKVVAVRQRNILGTSFHPELTDDIRLHQWFLSW